MSTYYFYQRYLLLLAIFSKVSILFHATYDFLRRASFQTWTLLLHKKSGLNFPFLIKRSPSRHMIQNKSASEEDLYSPFIDLNFSSHSLSDLFHTYTAAVVHLSLCHGRFRRQSETCHGWTEEQGSQGRFILRPPVHGADSDYCCFAWLCVCVGRSICLRVSGWVVRKEKKGQREERRTSNT